MYKVILALVALACCIVQPSSAAPSARWTSVFTGRDAPFFDLATARRKGSNVTVWLLFNHGASDKWPDKSMSHMIQWEYDCDERLSRQLTMLTYPRRDGVGKISNKTFVPTEWQPVVPDTIGEGLLNYSCEYIKPLGG